MIRERIRHDPSPLIPPYGTRTGSIRSTAWRGSLCLVNFESISSQHTENKDDRVVLAFASRVVAQCLVIQYYGCNNYRAPLLIEGEPLPEEF